MVLKMGISKSVFNILLVLWFIRLQAVFTDRTEIENIFVTNIRHRKDDLFCDEFTLYQNQSACSFVFQILSITENMMDLKLYNSGEQCVTKYICIKEIEPCKTYAKNVLPCHGMHFPLRSRLHDDDYFNMFYITVGNNQNKIMIYKLEKFPTFDEVRVFKEIEVNLAYLHPYKMNTFTPLTEESLSRIRSVNKNMAEIEIIYLRSKFGLSTPDSDRIQNLEPVSFQSLCVEFFGKDYDPPFTLESMTLRVPMNLGKKHFIKFNENNHLHYNDRFEETLYACVRLAGNKIEIVSDYKLFYGPRMYSILLMKKENILDKNGRYVYSLAEFHENLDYYFIDQSNFRLL